MASPKPLTRDELDERYPGLLDAMRLHGDSALARRYPISRQRISRLRESHNIEREPRAGLPVRSRVMWWLRDRHSGRGFARLAGASSGQMSAWCSGTRQPSWDAVAHAATILGWSLVQTEAGGCRVYQGSKLVRAFE